MDSKLFTWYGTEFVSIYTEGQPGGSVEAETRDIFAGIEAELSLFGLSLENTVRTRLWGRDRQSREQGASARSVILSGRARSVSASYIALDHCESGAGVAVDLLAMRPPSAGVEKRLVEYKPLRIPLRYLTYGSFLFVSGVTAEPPTLSGELAEILADIEGALVDAGCSWTDAVRVSFYLHRSEEISVLKELFSAAVGAEIPEMEYAFVDGYATEGRLLEVEVTARMA